MSYIDCIATLTGIFHLLNVTNLEYVNIYTGMSSNEFEEIINILFHHSLNALLTIKHFFSLLDSGAMKWRKTSVCEISI